MAGNRYCSASIRFGANWAPKINVRPRENATEQGGDVPLCGWEKRMSHCVAGRICLVINLQCYNDIAPERASASKQ